MYAATVIARLIVLPLVSTAIEVLLGSGDVIAIAGKWLVFWAVGVRFLVAGLRQVAQPAFTARTIFGLADEAAYPVVREVGFGNLAMGTLGLASLAVPPWIVPAAFVGGLYYILAGLGHASSGKPRNSHEQLAMVTDFLAGGLLLAFVARQLFS